MKLKTFANLLIGAASFNSLLAMGWTYHRVFLGTPDVSPLIAMHGIAAFTMGLAGAMMADAANKGY